ncbi:VCBS domain-containing protein, partial [Novosphingobium aerophilum]
APSDPESQPLSYAVASSPSHGQLELNSDGSFTYTPDADWSGEDSFTFTVNDGETESLPATVSLTIAPVNDAPVADAGSTSGGEDTVIGGKVSASDAEADALTYALAQGPAHGSIVFNADGSFEYTPDANWYGTDSFTFTANDGQSDSTPANFTITVDPDGSDPAVIGGDLAATITESTVAGGPDTQVSGQATVSDPDGPSGFEAGGQAGAYGAFDLQADGSWTYILADSDPAIDALKPGDVVTETFTIAALDGTTSEVVITIHGANDTAQISGTDSGAVVEAGGVANGTAGTASASGTLTVTDPDAGEAPFAAPSSLNGTYGTFSFDAATGAWSYQLDNTRSATQALTQGQTATETLTVTSLDGTASRTITITVTGTNDAAVIGGTTSGAVAESAAAGGTSQVTGSLTISDVDGAAQFVAGSKTGTYGSLTLTAAGAWTYVLDNANPLVDNLSAGQSLTETITVNAADGTAQVLTITINGANDVRTGGNGADALTGTGGNDSLSGAGGNDTLTGGLGNDTLDGGSGTDTASYAGLSSGVTVSLAITTAQNTGAGGTDTLIAIENLTGTSYDDTLTGNGGANLLTGGDGNDTLDGGSGADTLDGGNGIDTASYLSAGSAVTVSLAVTASQNTGGGGGDTLAGIENLTGSAFNDTLTGNTGDNILNGDAGNDTLDGGLGNDTLIGGLGTDTASYAAAGSAVTVSLAAGTATGGAGSDSLAGIENVTGSGFNDTLTGDDGANALAGGAGNDTLDGGLGNDSIDGGTGTDTVTFAAATGAVTVNLGLTTAQATGMGTDTISNVENLTGSGFDDTLTGSTLANLIAAGGGADSVNGGAGNDTLQGEAGNDTIDGGAGDDSIDGGIGSDTLSYASATAAVTVSLALATAQNTAGAGIDTVSGFENLTGSAFNDSLTGDGNANTIAGGAGNDTIEGGNGNDSLDGGAGTDFASYANASASVTVSLALAGAQNTGAAGSDVLTGFEGLIGSAFNDVLTGDANANALQGGSGNDTLDGGAGNDTLTGGAGTDTASYATATGGVTVSLAITASQVTGGSGSDTLSGIENLTGSGFADVLTGDANANAIDGGAGNDTLNGGAGADSLMGGSGNDVFVYSATANSTNAAFDVISDFIVGTDKIDLSAIDAVPGGKDNAFTWGNNAPTANGIWWIYDSASNVTHVYGDTDGNAATAELRIDLTGHPLLTSADFAL